MSRLCFQLNKVSQELVRAADRLQSGWLEVMRAVVESTHDLLGLMWSSCLDVYQPQAPVTSPPQPNNM
ncbi:hypothetical protein DPEC_G00085350 [Dallia pectoralis]|uniref:Uncharacterized protein n=1 Tax=Dallia pectoralis TaxID=75939 RepID=A0ACC2H0B7_DALPE|nr:hypothetical protein DPEC_G00085350 [Dallia pectoralis]